jgi:hypothetical protein
VKGIEWLLSDLNPSVKYWALKDLLDKPERDAHVQEARKSIAQQDVIKEILSLQNEKGFWGKPHRLWGYQNTVFQLLLLSELGLKGNSRIRDAIEFVFNFQLKDGSFSSTLKPRKTKYPTNEFCLTGIILKILFLFGYETDPRAKEALNFLISTGENGWDCQWYPMQKEKVIPEKCYMGGIKALAAFARLPLPLVTAEVKERVRRNVEPYLENRIYWYRRDTYGNRAKKPSWTRFAFPLFWQSDVLDALDVLTALGVKDERMQEAVELVRSKQVEGAWVLERTYPKDSIVSKKMGQPSKWITLKALRVLKRLGYSILESM